MLWTLFIRRGGLGCIRGRFRYGKFSRIGYYYINLFCFLCTGRGGEILDTLVQGFVSLFVNWALHTVSSVLVCLFLVMLVVGATRAFGFIFVWAGVRALFGATGWASGCITFVGAVDFFVSKLEAMLALVDEDSGAHSAELLANVKLESIQVNSLISLGCDATKDISGAAVGIIVELAEVQESFFVETVLVADVFYHS